MSILTDYKEYDFFFEPLPKPEIKKLKKYSKEELIALIKELNRQMIDSTKNWDGG